MPLSAAQASSPITHVVTIEPKRGGMLALKGFVLSILISLSGALALNSGKGNPDVRLWGSGMALAIGATYIALSLMKWKQQQDEDVAWIVAVLLGCASLSGLIL